MESDTVTSADGVDSVENIKSEPLDTETSDAISTEGSDSNITHSIDPGLTEVPDYKVEISNLEAQVAKETASIEQSVQTLISGLVAKLRTAEEVAANKGNTEVIKILADEMEAQNTSLSAAVVANVNVK